LVFEQWLTFLKCAVPLKKNIIYSSEKSFMVLASKVISLPLSFWKRNKKWRHDTQPNDIQHNTTQDNNEKADTQLKH
jgi:hypothetical protein